MLSKDTTKPGFVGLGLMGSRLVKRLHTAGWGVQAWNRSPEKAKEVSQQGIPIAASIAALCAGSNVILSCLANDAAVRAVYFAEGGILHLAKVGTIVLEMSTISRDLSLEIHREGARHGLRVLDLAISGSTPAVEAGTITLLAGGDRETFDECAPIFESLSRQCFLVGAEGAGVEMKLVVNLLLGTGMAAIAEAISLGEHLKIEKNTLLDVLSKTAVIPPAFLGKFKKIKSDDYSPEFPLRLMSKDMNLVSEAAASTGAKLPVASAVQKVFATYAGSIGDLDLSAITPGVIAGDRSEA